MSAELELHGLADRFLAGILRLVSHRPRPDDRSNFDEENLWREEATRRFFRRMPGWLDFNDKTVLDVGCGPGLTCLHLARSQGARQVVGVDIEPVTWALESLSKEPRLAERCEFRQVQSLDEIGERQFDVVLSQDSFEHYADPERFVPELVGRLAPGGLLLVGFGPLWKSPLGGHMGYITSLPWAHLLFPERVIMVERLRFRPAERARSFAEFKGGLNKMTLGRFRSILAGTGLECLYFETNRSDNPVVKLSRIPERVPPLREYFTSNIYSVWQKPA